MDHPRCWDPTSRLKSAREEGAGFFQLTRAYSVETGLLRFDVIAELKAKHPVELRELSWQNVYSRPDLQITAGIFKVKGLYDKYSKIEGITTENILAFADSAYNGGEGGLDKERRACKMAGANRCDPKVWFDNVENFCLKSRTPLYGNRSACDINRHHTRDVLINRADKYRKFKL